MKVSNVFSTSTLKQIFWKMKTFFKKLKYRFLVETINMKTHHFHSKLLCHKPMLRHLEWRLQNGPITKSGVLPVTTLFFWKICSSFRTSWKELIWCSNDPNVRICIFRKRWSLVLGWFFPVSILNKQMHWGLCFSRLAQISRNCTFAQEG